MTVLITGGRGQLGRAIAVRGGDAVCAISSEDLNICHSTLVEHTLSELAPTAVINCAACTKVDRGETDSARMWAVNRDGTALLAQSCYARAIPLIHVSTDYVFNGAGVLPYCEDDSIAPINVYGASKAAGEREVHAAGGIVVRTSWLFGEGGPSFVHTMLRLARERSVLSVVNDQHGCPTYTGNLAEALLDLARRAMKDDQLAATYHYCNSGVTTWHGFATAIVEELRRISPTPIACERIESITTAEYPTPARRPAYSVLDTARITALSGMPPRWYEGMQRVVADDARSNAHAASAT